MMWLSVPAQPPSPSEEPASPAPTTEMDSNGSKKAPAAKGKAASGSQQVAV